MRIGIDVYALSKPKLFTGINNYLYNILKHLEILDQENEYFLYNDKDIKFTFNNPRWHKRISFDLFGGIHTVWLNSILVGKLLKDNIDIFWQPSGALLPFFIPQRIKTLITIHDLVSQYYPETMEWSNRFVHHLLFKKSYMRADKIIVDSHVTARDIEKLFFNTLGIKRIIVIHAGGDNEKFIPLDKENSRNFVKSKFGIDNDYILFVGTIEPRKNLKALIKAFHTLVQTKRNFNCKLILVGKKGWGTTEVLKLIHIIENSNAHIKLLGYVDSDDLAKLYSGALVCIMPSLYEGFGLPILEAMTCGCPVITSNISSMPEVAGEAALLVDPYKIEQIANTIYKVIVDGSLREEMQRKGFENIKRFSWEKAARQTLSLINTLKYGAQD